MKVRIYRINKDNPLPAQANKGDAGYDCFASEDVFFAPGEIMLVPLGIIAKAPEGFHWKLCLRSSMAKKRGFMLANGVGIIDTTYCGKNDEIKALMKAPNSGYDIEREIDDVDINGEIYYKQGCWIKKGERICQLILEQNNEIEWEEQEDRNFAGKSRGGFGSTGV